MKKERWSGWTLAMVVAVVAFAFAGCGDDEDGPSTTIDATDSVDNDTQDPGDTVDDLDTSTDSTDTDPDSSNDGTSDTNDSTDSTDSTNGGDESFASLVSWWSPIVSDGAYAVALSDGSQFAAEATWSSTGPTMRAIDDIALSGDFDGDGLDDLLMWIPFNDLSAGSYTVSLSTGSGFADESSWLQSGDGAMEATDENAYLGDFDGDGDDDLLTWIPGENISQGSYQVSLSNGSAFGAPSNWLDGGSVATGTGDAMNFVGDFNGDGADDLLSWTQPGGPSPGAYEVSLSDGSSGFEATSNWLPGGNAALDGSENTEFFVGDFDGDGDDDLLAWTPSGEGPGSYEVSLSNGSNFEAGSDWLRSGGGGPMDTSGARAYVGDFDGDGKDDLLVWAIANQFGDGAYVVALSSGSDFGPGNNWLQNGQAAMGYGDTLTTVGVFQ